MSDSLFQNEKVVVRRRFIASALATGMGAICATDVLAGTNNSVPETTCGELTAADPLYLYTSLVPQLQVAAVVAARIAGSEARKSLSTKLEELWTLSDELKLKLARQARIQSTVDRLGTLAKIGRFNTGIAKADPRLKATGLHHTQAATQQLITDEIVRTAHVLSEQGGKTLKADEWELLQKLLGVIDDIKTVHQPAVVTAESNFDEFVKNVTASILQIQTTMMEASRHIIDGDNALAVTKIKSALTELRKLPSSPQPTDDRPESTTRDELVAMIEPILNILGGASPRQPRVSHHVRSSYAGTPLAVITGENIFLSHAVLQTSTVKSVVQRFLRAGTWWQVVGVTAACLPLWAAYSQTPQRLSLIRSAISAVPRGRGSNLDGAADALNRLTS